MLLWAGLGSAPEAAAQITEQNIPVHEVPHNWSFKPGNYPVGERFRLLAVTTGGDAHFYNSNLSCGRYRDGAIIGRSELPEFNSHGSWYIRKHGRGLAQYADDFRAVVSGWSGRSVVNARRNTGTDFSESQPGRPIWWVTGNKVADNYRDFYDGSWSNRHHRNIWGEHIRHHNDTAVNGVNGEWVGRVWTGSTSDGTAWPNHHYVFRHAEYIGFGEPDTPGKELNAGYTQAKPGGFWAFCRDNLDRRHPFYVLSPVFKVVAAMPGAPTDLSYTPKGTEIDLTWDAPDYDGGKPIAGYDYQWRVMSGDTWPPWNDASRLSTTVTAENNGRAATVTGLTEGSVLQVRVRARNEDETGDYSPSLLTAAVVGPPDPPANLRTEIRLDPTRVRFSWDPPPRDGGNAIEAYLVEHRQEGTSAWSRQIRVDAAPEPYADIPGLAVGERHEFRVQASNANWLGPWTEPVAIKVVERPDAPTGLAAALAEEIGDRVILSWTAPAADGGSPLTGYDYQFRPHVAGQAEDAGWAAPERVHDPGATGVVVDDLEFRTDYEFRVRARNQVHDGRFSPPGARVTTTLPTVTLVLEPATIGEGAFARVTARLGADSENETTVTVSAAGDGAVLGENRTLTIRDGELESIGAVTLTAVDDHVDGPHGTVTVSGTVTMRRLSELTNDPLAALGPAPVTLTVTDDDEVGIAVTPTAVAATERAGDAEPTFAVTLTSMPEGDVRLSAASGDAGEALVSTGGGAPGVNATLTFTAENWNTPQTVTVHGVDDEDMDGDQDAAVTVSVVAEQSAGSYATAPPATVSVRNFDDESAGIFVSKLAVETGESGASDSFDLALTSNPASAVQLRVSLRGEDGQPDAIVPEEAALSTQGGSRVQELLLTFDEGEGTVRQTVTVHGLDDMLTPAVDGDYAYTIAVAVVDAQSHDDYDGLTAPAIRGVNRDDDVRSVVVDTDPATPGVQREPLSLAEGETGEIAVSLTATPERDLVITAFSDSGDVRVSFRQPGGCIDAASARDFADMRFEIGFPPAPQVFCVHALDDAIVEGRVETSAVFFLLSGGVAPDAPAGSGYGDPALVPRPVAVTVTDDDGPRGVVIDTVPDDENDPDTLGVQLGAFTLAEQGEGAVATYTVVLESEPDVGYITVTPTPPAIVTVEPAELVFRHDDWDVPQTVTVAAVDDRIDNRPDARAGTITHAAAGSGYEAVEIASVPVTVVDDPIEVASVLVSAADLSLTEGGDPASYGISLNTDPGGSGAVTVTVAAADGLEYATAEDGTYADTLTLRLASEDWQVEQRVWVRAVNDDDINGGRIRTITHAVGGSGTGGYTTDLAVATINTAIADDEASAPFVQSVTGLNGLYGLGRRVEITVHFSEPVTVTGTPQLALETGDRDGAAAFVGIEGNGQQASFHYTVAAGDASADLDYQGADSLTLNGGSIRAVENAEDAVLTLPEPGSANSLSGVSSVIVETTAPKLIRIAVSGATLTLTYDEALEGDTAPAVDAWAVRVGGEARQVLATALDRRTVTLTLAEAVVAGQAATLTYTPPEAHAVRDLAGNRAGPLSFQAVTNLASTVAAVLVAAVERPLTVAEGGSATWSVVLGAAPAAGETVTVTVAVPAGAGVTVDADAEADDDQDTLTFTDADWGMPRTVTVTSTQNAVVGDEAVNLSFSAASGDPDYDGIAIGDLPVTVLGDDRAAGAPASLTAAPGDNPGEVALSWAAPAKTGKLDGAAATVGKYQVRRATSFPVPAGTAWTDLTEPTSTTFIATDLPGGQDYWFQVRAVTGVTDAAGEPAGAIATASVGVPQDDRPRDVRVAAAFPNSFRVSWTGPAKGVVNHYEVQHKRSADSTWSATVEKYIADELPDGGFEHVYTGLTLNERYDFRVNVCAARFPRECSHWVTLRGRELVTEPGNVSIAAVRGGETLTPPGPDGEITVTWSVGHTGGSGLTGHRLEWRELGGTDWQGADVPGAPGAHTATNLDPETPWEFRVRVSNAQGPSLFSAAAVVSGRPDAPGGVTAAAHATDSGRADLGWNAVAASGGKALAAADPVTRYRYRWRLASSTDDADWTEATTDDAATTSAMVAGLDPGTGYAFEVRAETAARHGDWSASAVVDMTAKVPDAIVLSIDPERIAEDADEAATVTVTAAFGAGAGALTEDVEVPVAVGADGDSASAGAAADGADYAPVQDITITIPAGSVTATGTFAIAPHDDGAVEGAETVTVSGTTTATGIATVHGATLTITDDDTPLVSVADARAAEGEAVMFTVSLSGMVNEPVTVLWATADGVGEGGATATGDYTAEASGSLTIPANTLTGTFEVATAGDLVAEGDETFTVRLTAPADGLPGGAALDDAQATGTIEDDDTAAAAPGVFAAVAGANAGEVDLSWTAPDAGTADGAAASISGYRYRTATSAAGLSTAAWQDIADSAVATGHTVAELALGRTHHFELRALTGVTDAAGDPAGVGAVTSAALPAAVSVADASADEGDAVTFTVTLSAALEKPLTLGWTTSDGTGPGGATAPDDYAAETGGTLTVPAQTLTGTFTVATAADILVEGDETFTVTLAAPADGLPPEAVLDAAAATGTISDDDDAPTSIVLSLDTASIGEGDSQGAEVTVTAAYNTGAGAPAEAVAVTVAVGSGDDPGIKYATEGADYIAVDDFTITIPARRTSQTGTFDITPIQDTAEEGAETISVTGTTTAAGLTVEGAEFTIVDDDISATIAGTAPDPLHGGNLDEAVLTVDVRGTTYVDPLPQEPSPFTLSVVPAVTGLSIESVSLTDEDTAELTLGFTGADLTADTRIAVVVAADAHTDSDDALTSAALTVRPSPPSLPGNLRLDGVAAHTSIGVTWDASGYGDSSATLEYRKRWRETGVSSWTSNPGEDAAAALTHRFTGLDPGAGYDLSVRACVQGAAPAWCGEWSTLRALTAAVPAVTSITPEEATEADSSKGGVRFALDRPLAAGESVIVTWELSPASGTIDVTAADFNEAVQFGAGQANTATLTTGNLRIPLTLVDDKRVEPSDAGGVVVTFTAVKFRPASGNPDGSGDVDLSLPVIPDDGDPDTIDDDDKRQVPFAADNDVIATPDALTLEVTPTSVGESGGATDFTAALTWTGDVLVPGINQFVISVGRSGDSATEGDDYAPVADIEVEFKPYAPTATLRGPLGQTPIFIIAPVRDSAAEGDETITVFVDNTSYADPEATVTITDDDVTASVFATDPPALTETNLDGAKLTVDLTAVRFVSDPAPGSFTLDVPGVRVAAGGVSLESPTRAVLTLAFDGTDLDRDVLLGLTVTEAAHTGTGDLFAHAGTVTAVREPGDNFPATGKPVISGDARFGQELSVSVDDIVDEDGPASPDFGYQWVRVASDGTEADIPGATDAAWTLVEADVSHRIGVRVSFTDSLGNAESLTSDATAIVTAPNVAPAFTSPATFNAAENGTDVGTVIAGDADVFDSATGYEITGGADAALFSIDDAGVLTFDAAPDFEATGSAAGDNAYQVTVEATSGVRERELTATQDITVNVTDLDEPPGDPANVQVSAAPVSSSLTVTWEPATTNNGPPLDRYSVQWKRAGEAYDATRSAQVALDNDNRDDPSFTHELTGLMASTQYMVRVQAVSDEGESPGVERTATTMAAPDRIILSVSPMRVGEEVDEAVMEVTGSFPANTGALSEDVTVSLSVGGAGSSATVDDDYFPVSNVDLAIPAGTTSGTADIPFRPKDDEDSEGDETVVISGMTGSNVIDTVVETQFTLVDNDQLARIDSTAPSPLTERRLDGAKLTVVLVATQYESEQTLREPGRFTLGATPPVGGLSVSQVDRAGDNTAVLTLAFTGALSAATEIAVTVTDPAHKGSGTLETAPVTVIPLGAAIAATAPSPLTEAALDGATLTIELRGGAVWVSSPPTGAVTVTGIAGVTVDDVARDAIDPVRAAVTLAFDGTDFDTEGTLTVTVKDAGYTGGARDLPAGTAAVKATPETVLTVVADSRAVSANEGDAATVTVELSEALPEDITVEWSTADGTAVQPDDYPQQTHGTTTLTVPAGHTTATFDVPTTEDTTDEDDETFTVTVALESVPDVLSGDVSVSATAAELRSTVTIVDDDNPPALAITEAPRVTEGDTDDTDTTTLRFTLTLSAASGRTVTVDAATGQDARQTATVGTDYTETSTTVTFAPGDTSETFDIPVLGDNTAEPDETVSARFSSLTNATAHFSLDEFESESTPGEYTLLGTITDDDTAPTTIALSVAPDRVMENAGAAVRVTVTAKFPDGSDVLPADTTVAVSRTGGTATASGTGADFSSLTPPSRDITIPAGMASGTGTFDITPANDNDPEGDETVVFGAVSNPPASRPSPRRRSPSRTTTGRQRSPPRARTR